ncbi:hypothetical protein OROGR_007807 [Orobanche gracilis]
MPSFSRILLIVLDAGILIFGVYYIYFAQNVNEKSSINPCLRQSVSSIQWIGVISLIVAAVGIIGTCFKLKALQSLHLWALLISTFAAVIFCVFVWAVMPKLTAELTYYTTAEHGVWLNEYRPILQKALANDKDLFAVKNCLREIDTCGTMANRTEDRKVIFIDVGCCNPPNRCGLEQGSSGRLVAVKNEASVDDECRMWARVGQNCYDCDSCKAGYLGNFQSEWEKSTTSRILCIVMLIATSVVAYCTFIADHFNKDDKDPKHGKLGGQPYV